MFVDEKAEGERPEEPAPGMPIYLFLAAYFVAFVIFVACYALITWVQPGLTASYVLFGGLLLTALIVLMGWYLGTYVLGTDGPRSPPATGGEPCPD